MKVCKEIHTERVNYSPVRLSVGYSHRFLLPVYFKTNDNNSNKDKYPAPGLSRRRRPLNLVIPKTDSDGVLRRRWRRHTKEERRGSLTILPPKNTNSTLPLLDVILTHSYLQLSFLLISTLLFLGGLTNKKEAR